MHYSKSAKHGFGDQSESEDRNPKTDLLQSSHTESQALALFTEGRLQEAAPMLRKLIKSGNRNHIVYGCLALIYGQEGNIRMLTDLTRKAIELNPRYAQGYYNLGLAMQSQGHKEKAISYYNKAISIKPDFLEAHYNQGIAWHESGELEKAINSYNMAIGINQEHPGSHNNLGNTWLEKGDLLEAMTWYRKAISLDGDYADAHFNLSFALLLWGDYNRGWREYEWRSRRRVNPILPIVQPATRPWSSKKDKKTTKLLLIAEQGLGDTIQFMRYAIELRNKGIDVYLCADQKLEALIKTSSIGATYISPAEAKDISDFEWASLLSVPGHLGVHPGNPIIEQPYLAAPQDLCSKWKKKLEKEKRPIIGINWQGNPSHENLFSRGRSLPLESFSSMVQSVNASLVSLQKGFGSEQFNACSFKDQFVECQDEISDTWCFLETAAIIANCDVVITSDTVIAHIAGGMGKTTWLLLSKVPDWRWGLSGNRTFWYQQMRLFRQAKKGDWDSVLEETTWSFHQRFKFSSG